MHWLQSENNMFVCVNMQRVIWIFFVDAEAYCYDAKVLYIHICTLSKLFLLFCIILTLLF